MLHQLWEQGALPALVLYFLFLLSIHVHRCWHAILFDFYRRLPCRSPKKNINKCKLHFNYGNKVPSRRWFSSPLSIVHTCTPVLTRSTFVLHRRHSCAKAKKIYKINLWVTSIMGTRCLPGTGYLVSSSGLSCIYTNANLLNFYFYFFHRRLSRAETKKQKRQM